MSLIGGLWGEDMCLHVEIFPPVDQCFIGTRDCVAKRGVKQTGDESSGLTGVLASVTEQSCMRLREVTELLLLSESGNLYLALQVAHYGLCLGALQFRLQCVLLHEGGEWG